MTIDLHVNNASTLLCFLESVCVATTHDEENIETLLNHYNELRNQEEKNRAKRYVERKGTQAQKERIAKMT